MEEEILSGVMEKEGFAESYRFYSIHTYSATGIETGYLKSFFKIIRVLPPFSNNFVEKERFVRLGDIKVEKAFRRQGLATKMIGEMERVARNFRASRIEGQITPGDRWLNPWLPEMYRKLGFRVEEARGAWPIIKPLEE